MNKVRARQVFNSANLSLAVVERVDTQHHRSTWGCQFIATVNPIAIIVSIEDERHALDMTGQLADLDELERELSDEK